MNSESELKACPFCGGEAEVYVTYLGMLKQVHVECVECDGGFTYADDEESVKEIKRELIEKWNRRAK